MLGNSSRDQDLLLDQFNGLSAEYEMKPDVLAPREGQFDFSGADRLIDFAEANNLSVRGHALLWHEATPDYFLTGTNTEIRNKLETFISTVVDRYRGRVEIWDVVNEPILNWFEPEPGPWRNTNWLQAVGGPEYVTWAFEAARAADPNAKLFLNDYDTENPTKRGYLVDAVQSLLDAGVPIDGVGHQCHFIPGTDINEVRATLDAIDNLFAGLEQHITELDMNIYTDPGECWERGANCQADYGANTPDDVLAAQAQQARDMFDMLITRTSVTNVTLWGLQDGQSWLNGNPIDRTNSPLLFNRNYEPKPAFEAITDPAYVIGG